MSLACTGPTTLEDAIGAAILDALPDLLAVERVTRTPDSSGGSTESYQEVVGLGAVPCRIWPTGMGGEAIVADRLGLVDPYTVTVPYPTDIRDNDELVSHGLRFHVQAAPAIRSGGVVQRILATVVA